MSPDTMLDYVRSSRDSIRFWNALARRYPFNAERYRKESQRNLRRACFWLDGIRIEREKMEGSNAQEA